MAVPKIQKHRDLFYTVTFSPDDGGMYAEIFNRKGETLHSTEIVGSFFDAREDALTWIDKQT